MILHAVRIDRICSLMAVENEEMSLAVCNLLQAVIDSLSGEDKQEHRGKEEALVLGRRHSSVFFKGVRAEESQVPPQIAHSLYVEVAWFILYLFSNYKSNRAAASSIA